MKKSMKKGIAFIPAILIAVFVLSGGYWLATRAGIIGEDSIDSLKISMETVDLSSSPIPKLEVSSLNLELPNFATPSFSGVVSGADLDFSADTKVNLAVPEVSLSAEDFMKGISIPVGAPAQVGTQTSAPPSAGQIPTSATQAPVIDCGQFASAPLCSYVGAPGSQGYEACKNCFPNK